VIEPPVTLLLDSDEAEGDLRHAPATKKRHLDSVLDTETSTLISEFKDPDEILRLYDRVIDLEEEVPFDSNSRQR
jgi:hypothetical protein